MLQAFFHERLLANVLRSNPLFTELPSAARTDVARAFQLRRAAKGELLFEKGKPTDCFYLLLRGACTPFDPRPDGTETRFPRMGEGDVFGEISLLLGKAATATVRTDSACTLLWLGRDDFDRLVLSHPTVKAELMRLSFERLQRSARLPGLIRSRGLDAPFPL